MSSRLVLAFAALAALSLMAAGQVPSPAPVASDIRRPPELVVRAVDARGQPWVAEAEPVIAAPRGGWPERPRIAIAPIPDGTSAWIPLGLYQGTDAGDGSLTFEVKAGREYLMGVFGGSRPWLPERVAIPEGAGRIERTIRVPESVELGTLSLVASDAQGPLDESLTVRIEDPQTGQELLTARPYRSGRWPLEIELPAGPYRLSVEGREVLDICGRVLLEPVRHGRFAADFQIQGGATLPLEAHLPSGARLDFALRGEADAEDRLAAPKLALGTDAEAIVEAASSAEIWLVPSDRWPMRIPFRFTAPGETRTSWLNHRFALGKRQTSEILPAGQYVLEARMPGGRVASARVTLKDGETTAVELEL